MDGTVFFTEQGVLDWNYGDQLFCVERGPVSPPPRLWRVPGSSPLASTTVGILKLTADAPIGKVFFTATILTISAAIIRGNNPFIYDTHGQELYVSDGTPAGTYRVADINQQPVDPAAQSVRRRGFDRQFQSAAFDRHRQRDALFLRRQRPEWREPVRIMSRAQA